MWHNHLFSQINKATERVVGWRLGEGEGVGQIRKKKRVGQAK